MGQPDEALADVPGTEIRPVSGCAPGPGRVGRPQVPMGHEGLRQHHADGQIGLVAQGAVAPRLPLVPRGQDQGEAGRHGDGRIPIPQQLVAVVEHPIPQGPPPVRGGLQALIGEREAELMALVGHGPLLGEGGDPVPALAVAHEGGDVLDDARFLVVGLLQQEGVVLDGLSPRGILGPEGQGGQQEHRCEAKGEGSHGISRYEGRGHSLRLSLT